MATFYPAGGQTYNLGTSIGSTDTTILLSSFTEPVSNTPYTMAYFNSSIMFGTIGPHTSSSEFISFTGITQNADGTATLTGVVRGLSKAYPYTSSVTFKLPHSGQSIFILSDAPQVFDKYAALDNDQTFTGIDSFAQSPSVPTPTNPTDAVNKAYADGLTIAGSPDSSTTLKGIGRISVSPNVTKGTVTITIASPGVFTLNSHGLTLNDTIQLTTTGALPTGLAVSTTYYVISAGLTTNNFEVSATLGGTAINTSGTQSGTHTLIKTTPIFVGDNDPRVPTQGENDALVGNNIDIAVGTGNKFATQTGLQHGAEKYAVDSSGSSTTYTATLSPVPTSLTDGMVVYVKIGITNSTTTPTLNVNGLGAKTIVKTGSVALAVSDIPVGQNTFIYDLSATKWVLQNPVVTAVIPNAVAGTASVSVQSSGTSFTTDDAGVVTLVLPKAQQIMLIFAGQETARASNAQIQNFTVQFNIDSAATIITGYGTSVQTISSTDMNASCNAVTASLAAGSHTFRMRIVGSSSGSMTRGISGILYAVAIN